MFVFLPHECKHICFNQTHTFEVGESHIIKSSHAIYVFFFQFRKVCKTYIILINTVKIYCCACCTRHIGAKLTCRMLQCSLNIIPPYLIPVLFYFFSTFLGSVIIHAALCEYDDDDDDDDNGIGLTTYVHTLDGRHVRALTNTTTYVNTGCRT